MNSDSNKDLTVCMISCDRQFRTCLREGESEVLCRVEWVPCESACHEKRIAAG